MNQVHIFSSCFSSNRYFLIYRLLLLVASFTFLLVHYRIIYVARPRDVIAKCYQRRQHRMYMHGNTYIPTCTVVYWISERTAMICIKSFPACVLLCGRKWQDSVKAAYWEASYTRFEFLTAVAMKITLFWDMTPCSMINIYSVPYDGADCIFPENKNSTFFRNFCKYSYLSYYIMSGSWDSVVGIATGYGLGDRGVRVRIPVGSRILYFPRRPDRLWGPSSSFSGGKAAGAWSWPLTSN
jgi:hypothetical protein